MSVIPGKPDRPFIIVQYADFGRVFTYKDASGTAIDLTDYTARFVLRQEVDTAAPAVELTTGSGVTLGGAAGTITIAITDVVTGTLTDSEYVWGLELTDGDGLKDLLLYGDAVVIKNPAR